MWLAPGPVAYHALPCVEAAGHWLMGLSHDVAVCGTVDVPGLVLAHWWSQVCSWVGGCGAGFPAILPACWWVGLDPDMAGCGFWHVPKLVLVHW